MRTSRGYRGGGGRGRWAGGGAYWYRPSFWIDDCPNPYNPYCPTVYYGADSKIDIDTVSQPLGTQVVAGTPVQPIVRAPLSTQRTADPSPTMGQKLLAAGVLIAATYGVLKFTKLIK
jgi:hypothetical protein